jgi:hypothetical protein
VSDGIYMFSWLCICLWVFPIITYLDLASTPAYSLSKYSRLLLLSSSSGLPSANLYEAFL